VHKNYTRARAETANYERYHEYRIRIYIYIVWSRPAGTVIGPKATGTRETIRCDGNRNLQDLVEDANMG